MNIFNVTYLPIISEIIFCHCFYHNSNKGHLCDFLQVVYPTKVHRELTS